MVRKLSLLVLLVIISVGIAAQDDTTTGFTSTYNFFGVICDTRAVVNVDGTIQAGYDIYYQVFNGTQGTGTALTALRRIPVDGTYSISEVVNYNEGNTVAAGSFGSIYVAIAREGDSSSTIAADYVDDIQDGCAEPTNTGVTSSPTDGSGSAGDGTTTGTGTATRILTPFGGILNPNYVPPARPANLVGPREDFVRPRQETPGLIFAECNDFPVAEPGILYDTDNFIVFWSWFAKTQEQAQAHVDNVNYSVTYYQTLPLPQPIRSEIQEINGLYWVFYYSNLANLLPGQYYIEYKVTWDNVITDGYDDYGPGTQNEMLLSGCGFNVLTNTQGSSVSHNSWPYTLIGR